MNFEQLNDEELAAHINAGLVELKDRHKQQEQNLAKSHTKQLADALSKSGTRKSEKRLKEKTHAAA